MTEEQIISGPEIEGVVLNDLPGIPNLKPGDLLDVTLKKSNRVRKGCRGKTYRILFERVGLIDVTDNQNATVNGVPLAEVIASDKYDGGWVLEGRLNAPDGLLQGFHNWSIAAVARVEE